MLERKRVGLVLAGGGGKGGYQIGVWKALKEIDIEISAIAGTSVGALNGALIYQGDYDVAECMWRNISPSDVFSLDPGSLTPAMLNELASFGITPVMMAKLPLAVRTKGVFSEKGLLSLMGKALRENFADSSSVPLYATIHQPESLGSLSAGNVHYALINNRNDEKARKALLASAALPGIFNSIEVDSVISTDGGWYWGLPHKNLDNLPITPLVSFEKCDVIIAVHLDRETVTHRDDYSGVPVIHIIPTESLGGLFNGVLDFNSETSVKRMEMGYNDAQAILKRLNVLLGNESERQKLWYEFAKPVASYPYSTTQINESEQERLNIKKDASDFNRIIEEDTFEDDLSFAHDCAPNLLELKNRLLLEKIDRNEIQSIDQAIASFLERNIDNARILESAAIEAIGALSSVGPQAKELRDQSTFSRFWGSLTGNNQRIAADNQMNLATSQYAVLTLLGQLQQHGNMSLEATITITNQLRRLTHDLTGLSDALNQQIRMTYQSMARVYCKLRNEFRANTTDINDLKRWRGLKDRFDTSAARYGSLPLSEQILNLAGDFIRLTNGEWYGEELLLLKQALISLHTAEVQISEKTILLAIAENPSIMLPLTKGLSKTPDSRELPLIETAKMLRDKTLQGVDAAGGWLALRHGIDWEASTTASDFLIELVYSMKESGWRPVNGSNLSSIKQEFIGYIDLLQKVAIDNNIKPYSTEEVDCLRNTILRWTFCVPLIGHFNVGKSRLLNTHLGREGLLKVEDGAETAIATELHFATSGEKVLCHNRDGNTRQYPLEMLSSLKVQSESIHYLEVHLENQALSQHPDLVLVDMPGLDSGYDIHQEAIFRYLDRSACFILCAKDTIKESTISFLRTVALYKKHFGLITTYGDMGKAIQIAEHNLNEACGIAGHNDVPNAIVSSRNRDIKGFHDVLSVLDKRKDEIFRERFSPLLATLAGRSLKSLDLLAGEVSLTGPELEAKKREIADGLAAIDQQMDKVIKQVRSACSGHLITSIVSDVRRALDNQRSALKRQMLSNSGDGAQQRIVSIAGSVFQESLNRNASECFKKVAAELNQYVSQQAYSGQAAGDLLAVDIIGIGDDSSLTTAGLGGAAGGLAALTILSGGAALIAALVVGGLTWLFSSNQRENEAEEAVNSAIESVCSTVQQQAQQSLTPMGENFIKQLQTQVDAVRQERQAIIVALEEQLKESATEHEKTQTRVKAAREKLQILIPTSNLTVA